MDLRQLLEYLKKKRPELFVQGDSGPPAIEGILQQMFTQDLNKGFQGDIWDQLKRQRSLINNEQKSYGQGMDRTMPEGTPKEFKEWNENVPSWVRGTRIM